MTTSDKLKSPLTAKNESSSNDPIRISNRVLILNSVLFGELMVVMILLLSFWSHSYKYIALAGLLLASGCILIYYYRAETSSRWWYVPASLAMGMAVVFGMLLGA